MNRTPLFCIDFPWVVVKSIKHQYEILFFADTPESFTNKKEPVYSANDCFGDTLDSIQVTEVKDYEGWYRISNGPDAEIVNPIKQIKSPTGFVWLYYRPNHSPHRIEKYEIVSIKFNKEREE